MKTTETLISEKRNQMRCLRREIIELERQLWRDKEKAASDWMDKLSPELRELAMTGMKEREIEFLTMHVIEGVRKCDLSKRWGVSYGRAFQICDIATRKLRNPKRTELLRDIISANDPHQARTTNGSELAG